jgi:hypothetical protein
LAKLECECGIIITRKLTCVISGDTKSCGCLQSDVQRELAKFRNLKHGKASPKYRLYRIWCGMLSRCYKSYSTGFQKYGGRGITVCEEWHDFKVFEEWALSNGYNDNLTIHRKNDGNYCPSECSWETYEVQNNCKSDNIKVEAWGEIKTLAQWIRDERCQATNHHMIKYRIRNGWNPEKAISTPPLMKNRWAGEPE